MILVTNDAKAAEMAVDVSGRVVSAITVSPASLFVGSVRVVTVILRADPPRITTSNSTHVFASVLDSAGNPVANVPVTFQVTDNIATEFFDATFPIFTNNNGEAENVLRTRRTTAGTAKVKAFAPGNGALVTSAELSIAVQ